MTQPIGDGNQKQILYSTAEVFFLTCTPPERTEDDKQNNVKHILFQYFKHRYTAQDRNTARGVPAFSDRLFGKCNPRKLPLKLPSAAGIISHSTNALPRARQASSAASSGVSVQITLSQTRFTPALSQSLSQVRIHSPSPQP